MRFETDAFRGLVGACLCMGGKVEERPGGDVDIIEGRSSLGLFEFKAGNGSLVTSTLFRRRIGGSSIEDLIAFECASVSDAQS